MNSLQILRPTIAKQSIAQASSLPASQKAQLAAGTYTVDFEITSNHYHVTFDHAIATLDKSQSFTTWFVFAGDVKSFLSVESLLQIAPYADPAQIKLLLPFLLETMQKFSINTPLREAHFLAQVAHESGSFNYLEELASGEDYEGREDLGNTEPGDGCRFKGRGLIQITGRDNYTAISHALGVDFVSNPEKLCEPHYACLSAGWFWNLNGLNAIADRDDVETITRIINGGYNGLADREAFLADAKEVLQA